MPRLLLILLLVWAAIVAETSLLPFAPAPFKSLQPALGLIFVYSIRSSRERSLAAAVIGGLLLDYWSILPFGIVLASTVLAVLTARDLVARWLSHRPAIASFSVCVAGLGLFFALRDALGAAAGLLGADSGWVAERFSLEIQLGGLATNAAAAALLVIGSAAISSTLRKTFRLRHVG